MWYPVREVISMKETRYDRQASLIFTLLQVAAVGIALAGLVCTVMLSMIGVVSLMENLAAREAGYLAFTVLAMLAVAAVFICSMVSLYQFFMMCSRLRQGSAFTERNGRALTLMAVLCAACGGIILVMFVLALLCCWQCGPGLFLDLVAVAGAAYLCVALVAWALAVLVKRATALQQESELTI